MDTLLWVEIETTKSTDDTWSLKGQMHQSVFKAIVSNTMTKGYFKLDQVYWITSYYDDNGTRRDEKLRQYGGDDRLKAYRGDIYLKVEHIVSISPIDGEAELARFRKPSDKHLSLVSPIKPSMS